MKTYTAHVRPDQPPVLVKEAFAWGAFLFGPLWLLCQRAWIAGILTAIAFAALALAVPPPFRGLLMGALAVILGLHGRDLVRWSLGRRGYAFTHVVAGRNPDDAFLRLLDLVPDMGHAQLTTS